MIVRSQRPDRWTVLDNATIRDNRLSWRSRGLLCYLLSMPDNWQANSLQLAAAGTEGRDAVRTALRELEDAGYLVRHKVQDKAGRWTTCSYVYDRPQLSTGLPTTGDGLLGVGNLGAISNTLDEVPTVVVTDITKETGLDLVDNLAEGFT